MKRYDVILIGTGQATGTILPKLLSLKKRIAVVEGGRVGGTCVNWGCTPTKTLLASARVARAVRDAERFGIYAGEPRVDYGRVMERVNEIRRGSSDGFRAWLEKVTDFYDGWGSFEDAHTVRIGDARIRGEEILIHTGTLSRKPDLPGLDSIPWLDNRGLLDLAELPEHLVILGGSYIGMEFAQAYRALGSRVSVLEFSDRLVPREDPDFSDALRELLEAEGVEILLNVRAESVRTGARGGIELAYRRGDSPGTMEGSHLLAAVGRTPNTAGLDLDKAGVLLDDRGFIRVDDRCRTSVPHIFALGDVNGRGAFTHTSVHDGQIYLSALEGGSLTLRDRVPVYSLYTDPPLARVGASESELKKAGRGYRRAVLRMSEVPRAREKGETRGFVKILVDEREDFILGAGLLGTGGDEAIGILALAIRSRLPYSALTDTVLPHPTLSEMLPWMFENLEAVRP